MQVSYEEAIQQYQRFPDNVKAATLHPTYVIADAKRDMELTPVFFVFEQGENLFYHGFHLGEVPNNPGVFDIQSPYGYGGPLSTTHDPAFLANAWKNYQLWCKQHNILVEFIRFHPLLQNERFYYGQQIIDRQTIWVDLSHNDLLASYGVRARTAIRKAWKNGLRIEWWSWEEWLPIFYPKYIETMGNVNASSFYFFKQEYFRGFQWEHARFAVCLLDEEVLASAVFLASGEVMEYHLSASSLKGKKFNATNLLLHGAALYGKRNGYKKLFLGGGTGPQEENPLFFFKKGFSEKTALFSIGKKVHNESLYRDMKAEWELQYGKTSRILFYK